MLCTIVNCANGRILWTRIPRGGRATVWVCQRDQFQIISPETSADAAAFIQQIAQHSQQLAGAVQSFVQVTL